MSVDRLYSASVFVMMMLAIVPYALATGGYGHLAVTCFVLPLAYYWVEVRREELVSRRTSNFIILAALAWAVFDFFQFSFIYAVANFLVVVVLVKAVIEKNVRDFYIVFSIGIVLICTTAALTTQLYFGVILAAYVPAAVLALMLFTLERDAEGVVRHVPEDERMSFRSPVRQIARATLRSSKGFVVTGVCLSILVLVGAGVGFVLFPRTKEPIIARTITGNVQTVTGFSETVQLNDLGQILEERNAVMNVKLTRDGVPYRPLGENLYWRGLALAKWDGRGWYNDRSESEGDVSRLIWPDDFDPGNLSNVVVQDVTIDPLDTRVLFALYRPILGKVIDLRQEILIKRHMGLVAAQSRRKAMRYRVASVVHEPTAAQLDQAPRVPVLSPGEAPQLPAEFLEVLQWEPQRRYLQPDTFDWLGPFRQGQGDDLGLWGGYERFRDMYLSTEHVSARVKTLAREVAPKERYRSDYEVATAIEAYLRNPQNFSYTLDLRDYATESMDPIEEFLFREKKGHCSLFASAMALMLRCQGVPARIVNGFRGGRWNNLTESYWVYSNYAHSWVEVYFRGHGWVTFDPTPGSAATLSDQRYMASRLEQLQGWFQMQWTNRVIGFEREDQKAMYSSLRAFSQRLGKKLQDLVGNKGEALARWSWKNLSLTARIAVAAGSFALAVVAWLLLRRVFPYVMRRAFREEGLRTGGTTLPKALRFYNALLDELASAGFERKLAVPPLAFAAQVAAADASVGSPFLQVTRVFYEARYGHRLLTREELRAARELSRGVIDGCRSRRSSGKLGPEKGQP
ncbi:MAG: DUF3488 and transglutaminase-like domain-containing protein [Planctomycetota bacterium]